MMNIDDLTLGQIKQIKSMCGATPLDTHDQGPWQFGKAYMIRTVTHYYIGVLTAVHAQELVIEEAAWIPDTGRFNECVKDGGSPAEAEPYPDGPVIIGRGAIIDASIWSGALQRVVK